MIYLIYGENTYKQELELNKLVAAFDGQPEHINIDTLTLNTLADIVRGGSLFSSARLVVIRGLATNTQLFNKLAEWGGELPDDTTLILVEPKIDKRTKAYKMLSKTAKVVSAEPIGERDSRIVEKWLQEVAHTHGVVLSAAQVSQMVQRSLVAGEKPTARTIDQMQLQRAVEALRGCAEVTDESIATVLPPAVKDTVFDLIGVAAKGDIERVDAILSGLTLVEDGHRVLALTFSQWSQLVMVSSLGGAPAEVAASLGVHPYAAQKLQDIARHFSRKEVQRLTELAARLDASSKNSEVMPWDAVHRLLYAIASRDKK